MGKHYGKLPSELFRLSPFDYALNLACMVAADGETAQRIQREMKRSKGMVFPTVPLTEF